MIGPIPRVARRGSPVSGWRSVAILLWVALASWTHGEVLAQQGVRHEVFVNSEAEAYLRNLQVGGAAELYPWSIRGFSPPEIDSLLAVDSVGHPWARRFRPEAKTTGLRAAVVRPAGRLIYNTGFPEGENDGPVWAGRGLTGVVQAGVSARWGPVSATLAPLWFHAANAPFDILPNRGSGDRRFADSHYASRIDLPQRFGDGSYSRLDPGQSTIRVDLPWAAAGISTANQHWGPAAYQPILLGNNAPGFFHGFVGSASPVPVGVGDVHGRIVWGRLEQSDYSWITSGGGRRFMSGVVAVFLPRGVDGLELGGARFFHTSWPEGGLRAGHFLKPLESVLKVGLERTGFGDDDRSDDDNQLASVFARWVFAGSGFEVYGEFGRDDHNFDFRDLALEPDHASAYLVGFRKVWPGSEDRLVVLRGESGSSRASHIAALRYQPPFYTNGGTQGHTHRGQLLGSALGYGGAASSLGVDWYSPGGRVSAGWTRAVRRDRALLIGTWQAEPQGDDVEHALTVGGLLFRGRFDVEGGLTGSYELNRHQSFDAFNLNATLGLRWAP